MESEEYASSTKENNLPIARPFDLMNG